MQQQLVVTKVSLLSLCFCLLSFDEFQAMIFISYFTSAGIVSFQKCLSSEPIRRAQKLLNKCMPEEVQYCYQWLDYQFKEIIQHRKFCEFFYTYVFLVFKQRHRNAHSSYFSSLMYGLIFSFFYLLRDH